MGVYIARDLQYCSLIRNERTKESIVQNEMNYITAIVIIAIIGLALVAGSVIFSVLQIAAMVTFIIALVGMGAYFVYVILVP